MALLLDFRFVNVTDEEAEASGLFYLFTRTKYYNSHVLYRFDT